MLDYQRIADDVRSSLYSHSVEGMDFLRAAAADYSLACDEVNERLRQCGTLLRQGLRSEAIRLADIDPNLLDVVSILDLPGRDPWIELLMGSRIAPPAPLMLDVAAELNEAYAAEQPLAALLQRHRLFALAHCPLPARIEVLRRLAEMDANNPVWQEDLQTFEGERQKQIQAEVEAAARKGDTTALAALDAELSSPAWRNPPPPALATSAVDATTTLRYWAAQSQLEKLVDEFTSAMSRGRVDLAQSLQERWREMIGKSGFQPYEQLAQRVAPALKWAQEHLERESALKALSGALGGERSSTRLQELYRRAARLGKVRTDLEERYRARLEALERADRRRRWFKIAGAAAGGVAVMLTIGWIVSNDRFERNVATARDNLSSAIERGDIERAETLAENLTPPVQRDPRIQETLHLLDDKRKGDARRQAEFSRRVKTARYGLDEVLKSLGGKPRQTAVDALREQLDGIEADLKRASQLARTEENRAEIASAEESSAQVKGLWQSQLDKAFLNRYEGFEKRLKELEGETRSSPQEQQSQIADYEQSLRKWELASTDVGRGLFTRVKTLDERLAALEKGLQEQEREDRDEKHITAAVGDIQGYVKALQGYMKVNPDSDRARDFQRVVEESLCWQAVAEWQKVAAQWRSGGLAGLRPPAAQEMVALAKPVAENFADCAECESLRTVLPYIQAIARRSDGGERIEAPLKKLFADPLLADAWMVETKEGAADGNEGDQDIWRYYFREQPNLTRESPAMTTFVYVSGFDGKTKNGWLKPGARVQYVGRAPQTIVAELVLPILKGLNDGNWEQSFCRMIRVVHADRAMDPILKVNLLQQVLETGARGSHCLEKAFERHLTWIKEARIDVFANWLNPGSLTGSNATERKEAVDVAKERKEAAAKLESFPDVVLPTKAVEQDLRVERKLPEFRWVGWLRKNRGGRWECLMNSEPDVGTGSLFVVYRRATTGKPVLEAIGRLDGKVAAIDAAGGPALTEGRAVYLKVP